MPNGIFTLTQVNQAVRQGAWTGFIAPTWVEYLVVAGGGGGGGNGGGGGAGGLLTGVVTVLAGTSYTVTVGSGGAGGTASLNPGSNGVASVFGSISSSGGGGGGGYNVFSSVVTSGSAGGSGGGGGRQYDVRGGTGGQGTGGQGNKGGDGSKDYASGGGGGAGTIGLNAFSERAGNGGSGIASAISGTVTTYAGGGAGTTQPSVNPPGSVGGVGGGGGPSPTYSAAAGTGSSNSGGGGGGGWGADGGAGGSGVVIVRYPGTVQYFTGGTLSYANGYVIHTFNASGTLAPTTPTPYVANDYQISRSLRFNSADGAYLNRTPASAGNRKTWTWSGWVKRSALSTNSYLFGNLDGSGLNGFGFQCIAGNTFDIFDYSSSAFVWRLTTTQVFRDPSAWYHFVLAFDSTQATSANRVRFYVNGVEVTAFTTATYPTQNYDGYWNNTSASSIGRTGAFNGQYFNGYITETNFIDGQALTPSSFGYYDFNTGVWAPTKFVGVYGTNGFYLNFSDNSNTTAATLGRDYSGNSNNWTPNNFSVSAGAGNDSLVDVPTNWGTDTGVGGSVRGNYATLNPLDKSANAGAVNGNLDATSTGGSWVGIRATFGMQTGKWYCEYTPTSGTFHIVSVSQPQAPTTAYIIDSPFAWGYQWDGQKVTNSVLTSYGSGWGVGDIIGIAFDADAGTITFYKNNVSQGVAFSGLTSGPYIVGLGIYPTATGTFNFGQRPFAYTAPSGFRALNTQNLPTPTIGATTATQANKYFDVVLRNGGGPSGATYATTINMANGAWLWDKPRNQASDNYLVDSVRGLTRFVSSNQTSAEVTIANWFTGFNNGSFTTGTNDWGSGVSIVDWIWAANGTGVTNTAGSITSTVSANTTSGFSVVTYTGNGTAGATIGHGIGSAPRMIIVKDRNYSGGRPWPVYHASLGNTQFLYLNTTDAAGTNTWWNNTTPTSSVFTVGSNSVVNFSGTSYVAYCFAEVPGYSRFGSYVGNGSADGPFVFCGFRPAYVMIKRADATGNWILKDTTRAPYNADGNTLIADLADAEYGPSNTLIDELSNGFKCRDASASINFSGNTYIFMAFASAPQKFALAR
jgi:hypothetical protein